MAQLKGAVILFNKKTILVKGFYFIYGILLLVILSILNYFGVATQTSYFLNSAIVAISIIISVIVIYKHSKELNSNIHLSDVMLSFALSILIYAIYFVPLLGFYKLMGVNNSVILIFVFVLYSFFLRELSAVLLNSKNYTQKNLSNAYKYNTKDCFETIIKYISVILVLCSFAGAVFNIFVPEVDMSLPLHFILTKI